MRDLPSDQRTPSGSPVGRWPSYVPKPRHHHRATVHPCERCDALTLNGSQSVVIRGCSGGIAYMRCKACGFEFKRPIAEEPQRDGLFAPLDQGEAEKLERVRARLGLSTIHEAAHAALRSGLVRLLED